MIVFPLIFFVFSLVVFLGVYADEFKSMTMIGVIGRGFSREKMVIVKFIDSLLLLILQTGGFALVLFIGIKLCRALKDFVHGLKDLPCAGLYDYGGVYVLSYE